MGYAPAVMLGTSVLHLVHPEDVSEVQQELHRAERMVPSAGTILARFRHRDGSWRVLEVTGNNCLKISDVHSEYATSYEVGYRWHDNFMVATASAYLQDVHNYLASVQLDPADFITSNIGTVKIYGISFEAGTRPWHGFTAYASAQVQNSVLSNDLAADYTGSTILYADTHGKQLVDTPNWILGADIGYAEDGFFGDVQPQCLGQRAIQK